MATPLGLWLFNEAASGTTPTSVLDSSTGTAVNLTPTYTGTAAWSSLGSGRGLDLGTALTAGARSTSGSIGKIRTALSASKVMTWELVIDYDAAASSGGTICDLAGQTNQSVGLYMRAGGTVLDFYYSGDQNNACYSITMPTTRTVVHVVYDSAQATAANRFKVYFNGTIQTLTAGVGITLNSALIVDTDAQVTTGFDINGIYGIDGIIYYLAVYAAALSSVEVAANATALAANDDADPNGGAVADNPPTRKPRKPLDETPREEWPQRREWVTNVPAVVADNPPTRRPRSIQETPVLQDLPQRRALVPQLVVPDDPFLAPWADRGEAYSAEDRPRQPRSPLAGSAVVASTPPLVTRRLPQEALPDEPRQQRRGIITPVDPPPLELRRVAVELQSEEPIRRLRVTPDAVDAPPLRVHQPPTEQAAEEWRRPRTMVPADAPIIPGDQPPNRARFRAEEFQLERPIQRLEIPWPSGSAPVGDAPPLLARKRPEETQAAEPTQRRGVPPADAPVVPDAPPVRAPRAFEAAAPEERPRPRLVPPLAPAADPPPLRRWIRVEEPQADETRPRRFLVFVAPAPADAPPLPARRVPFELALSEPVQRRRVTPPNAPIVPGDLPVFRPGRTPLERAIEERPQRRLMNLAGPSAIVRFNPRFTVKAPANSRAAKAPASSRKAKAYPRR